jgi:hypothetical protein
MAQTRREKSWTVSDTSVAAVRNVVVDLLAERNIRITAEAEGTIDGQGGSALTSAFVWTDKTAPFRVHINFWPTANGVVMVEAAFEERPQFAKAGHAKTKKYSKLADEFLDALRASLGRLGRFDTDSVSHQSSSADIPDQLKKLAELRDAGVLTNEEFDAKKAELLSRM